MGQVIGQGSHIATSGLSFAVGNYDGQTVSTLSTGISNLARSLDLLADMHSKQTAAMVEMQKKQIEAMVEMQNKQTEAIKRGFDCLVQCFSRASSMPTSLLSPLRKEDISEVFEPINEVFETAILVELMRPNGTPKQYELLSVKKIFESLGGKDRKTETGSPPIDLLRPFVASAWRAFLHDSNLAILPFILDWSSDDTEFDYEKGWFNEWAAWNVFQDVEWKRRCGLAVLLADMKPCLVVFFKNYDTKSGEVYPLISIITPKSLDKVDLPIGHLENFFFKFVSTEIEREHVLKKSVIQTLNPRDKDPETVICHGVYLKDLFVKFSPDGRAKNDFTDVIFWLVTVCSKASRTDGEEEGRSIFLSLKDRLSSSQENNDIAAYRRIVSEALFECVIMLVEKKYAVLKNDDQGNTFDENTPVAEFVSFLKQQSLLLGSGKNLFEEIYTSPMS